MSPERWRHIEQLYFAALDYPAATRSRFLEQACRGDDALLREVGSLLTFDHESEHPQNMFQNDVAPELTQPTDLLLSAGNALGPYRILAHLGGGGMGEVYIAQDTREANLHRKVALKVLRRNLIPDPEQVQRFRQEAYAASALNHPGIVTVFEIGEEEGRHFIATELVEGQTLQQAMSRNRPELSQSLQIGIQIASALAAAHDAGIVHRDIKPANIILRPDGYIKIIDFGVAKLIESSRVAQPPNAACTQIQTRAGWVVGTPRYMAPEQVLGLELDGRCDIYSLGIVLYELIAGRNPFDRTTETPQLRSYAPGAPPELERVIAKTIVSDREQRYATAGDLLRDLKNVALDLQLETRGNRAHSGRRITRAATLAPFLIALAAGLLWLGKRVNTARSFAGAQSIAVLPFVDMSQDHNQEYIGDGVAEEVMDTLAKTSGLRVAGRMSSFQFKGGNSDVGAIARKLNVRTVLEGSVRRQGNRARISVQLIDTRDGYQMWTETFDQEINDIFAVEQDIARSVAQALRVRLFGESGKAPSARRTNIDAYNAYLLGRYFLYGPRSSQNLEKAVSHFQRAVQLDARYAPAWAGLGRALSNQAAWGYVPDEQAYPKARDAVQRALALDSSLGEAYAFLGDIQGAKDWDWAAADASFRRALELEPGNAVVLGAAGESALTLGRLDRAIELYRRAIELDPLYPSLYFDLGLVLHDAGRNDEARAFLNKALELGPDMNAAHFMLARAYLAQSNPQKALAEAQKEKHPILGACGLAMAHYAAGNSREADDSLAGAIAKFQTDAPYQIALVYAFRHQRDELFKWLDRAYNDRDAGLSEIRSEPLFSPFRADPQYQALLRKLRLL